MSDMALTEADKIRRRLQEYEEACERESALESEVCRLDRECCELRDEARPYQELKDVLAEAERRIQEVNGEMDALNGELERGESEMQALDAEIASWTARTDELQEELDAGNADDRRNGKTLKVLREEKRRAESDLKKHHSALEELQRVIKSGRSAEKTWTGLCRDARVLLARWKTTNQMLEAGGHLVEEGHLAECVDDQDREALNLLKLMVAPKPEGDAFWCTEKKGKGHGKGDGK